MAKILLSSMFITILLLFGGFNSYANQDQFLINGGQAIDQDGNFNQDVLYIYSGHSYNASFYKDHFTYEVFTVRDEESVTCDRIELWFHNLNSNLSISNSTAYNTSTNYYKNGLAFNNLMACDTISYMDVWPGVNLDFYVSEGRLKYDIIVEPWAQRSFEFKIEGAQSTVSQQRIIYTFRSQQLSEELPWVYINTNGNRADYHKLKVSSRNNKVRYQLPGSRPGIIVIDPIAYGLKYSTFYGGGDIDFVTSIDHFRNGEVVIGGYTLSTNNIATTGAYQTTITDFDVLISRFDSTGQRKWGTYFGGAGYDRSYAITVDRDNNIIVSGNTFSGTGIASIGTHQQSLQSVDDAFLAKFDSTGQYIWGTYYGGNGHDFIGDVGTDSSGNIYITGHTRSPNLITTLDAHNNILLGLESAFMAVFDSSGLQIHGTYYGSGSLDVGWGILPTPDGEVYMSGYTSSSSEIAFGAAYQPSYSGGIDGFLVKFSESFTPIWGTYLGGTGEDQAFGICLDDSLNVYVTGNTTSSDSISYGAVYQDSMNSGDEAFLMKFDSSGNKSWGTYIGGPGADYIYAIKSHMNTIWLAGHSTSSALLTGADATNPNNAGMYDNIILNFDKNGNKLWSTFTGGLQDDFAYDLAILNDRDMAIAGYTGSSDLYMSANAHQSTYGGQVYDGFWQKLCKPLSLTEVSLTGTQNLCSGDTLTLESLNSFPKYQWSNGDTLDSTLVYTPGKYWLITEDSNACPGRSDTITVVAIDIISASVQPDTNVLCVTDSIVLSLDTSFVSYLWNTGDTTAQISAMDSGAYWVLSLDTNGCWNASDTLVINVLLNYHTIDTIGSTTLCSGGSVVLLADTSFLNIIWSNGDSSYAVTLDSAGSYSFTATDTNGCLALSDTVTVVQVGNPNPVVSLNSSGVLFLCEGDSVELATDSGYYQYNWSNGAATAAINVGQQGLYYVLVTDSLGCTAISDSATIILQAPGSPLVTTPDGSMVCEGDSLWLLSDTDWVAIQWSSGQFIEDIHVTTEGEYYYTAIDSQGCASQSDTISVQFHATQTPAIHVVVADTAYCVGSSVILTTDSAFYIEYLWSNNETIDEATFIFDSVGNYIVSVTVLDTNNCTLSDTIELQLEQCLDLDYPKKPQAAFNVYWNLNQVNIVSNRALKSLVLIDPLGHIIQSIGALNKKDIIIRDTQLKPGTYFIRALLEDDTIQIVQFIVTP